MRNTYSNLKLRASHDRWERQGSKESSVAAAHFVDRGKPVDCYGDIAKEYRERLSFVPSDRVLEVGCGSGCLLLRVKDYVSEIVGTDFSASMLAHLEGTGVETHLCDAASLPFPDASFDKVYCHGVVQYFIDEEYATRAIDEMLRVCRPGGAILIGDVVNALLKKEYLQDERQSNSRGLKRLKRVVSDLLVRPLYHRFKYGKRVDNQILFLTPFFFKKYFANKPHRWMPLLETVESKPLSFLRYRYDVLVHKIDSISSQ